MRFVLLLLVGMSLSGCVVGAVVGAAVDVTATAVETAVDVGAGVVTTTADIIIPDSDDEVDD